MSLLQQDIKSQIMEAMKARDSVRLETLRGLSAQFVNELVTLKRKPTEELSDDDALTVIRRAVKQRKDSIEQFEKGGRKDLADKEKAELVILETYLPQMMSKDEVMKIAEAKKTEIEGAGGSTSLTTSKLMSALMKELKGKADGSVVKEVVDEILI